MHDQISGRQKSSTEHAEVSGSELACTNARPPHSNPAANGLSSQDASVSDRSEQELLQLQTYAQVSLTRFGVCLEVGLSAPWHFAAREISFQRNYLFAPGPSATDAHPPLLHECTPQSLESYPMAPVVSPSQSFCHSPMTPGQIARLMALPCSYMHSCNRARDSRDKIACACACACACASIAMLST